MKTSGTILQIMAWIVFICSVGAAILTLIPPGNYMLAVAYVAGGVITGALLSGFGAALFFVEDMAIDARRTADALDALVQRRTGVGSLPRDAAKRLRQQPPTRPT